ncbi:MAG: ESPR-type extended signal peptide-containing protein [Haemophilus seminalis]
MNHIYKVIWNTITQTWVAVSELSRAKGKTKSSKTLSAVVLAATSGILISGQAQSANEVGSAKDNSSVVFGIQSHASHDAVAVGGESNARAYEDVAIGYKATSGAELKIENGKEVTHSSNQSSVAVGTHAQATHVATTAIGAHAQAIHNFATAVGAGAIANHENASAFGEGAKAQGTYSTALGKGALATEDYAVALGKEASSTNTYSTSIGTKANATGQSSLAIGGAAIDSLPIKTNKEGKQYSDLEDGVGAKATGQDSAAIGASANATAKAALAVGKMANASANSTIAVGDQAQASGEKATSIGAGAIAKNEGTIAIGNGAKVGATNGNVAANNGIAIGTESESKNEQAIAVGKKAIAAGNNSIALGNATTTTGGEGVAIGNTASASHHSVAFGSQAKATAEGGYSSAFGNESEANKADSSALGNTAKALAKNATSVGAHSKVTETAENGSALGRSANVSATNGTALGSSSKVEAENGTAVGTSATVSTAGGVALGQGSKSTRAALDGKNITITSQGNIVSSNHITDKDNSPVSDVYAPVKLINDSSILERVKNTIKGTAGAVSLGNDSTTRQLTNLAPGSADSDAVNVAQLKAVVGGIVKYNVTSPDKSITIDSKDETTDGVRKTTFNVTMNTTAVKDAAAWKIKANKETDNQATSVKGGDIVTFKTKDGGNSGDTIKITRNGKELTFEANFATIRTPGTGMVNVDDTVKDNWLAKAKNVAEAINASGWILQANGNKVGLINPGNKVNIATDANSGITITPTNENADGVSTIKLKANVTGLTAGNNVTISSKDGNYTINAIDTNTQASVSPKSGSPITVTKTTTTPNSPDYAVGLNIDDKTLEIKGGKLAARTQAQAIESVEKKDVEDNIAEVDVKSGSTKGAANAVYTVAVTKSAVKDAAAWNIKEGSETTSTAVKGGDTLTLSDTNTIDVVHNGKDFTFNAKTATIQTEQKQAITKIDVSNAGITTKTTGGNNTPTGRFVVPTGNDADKHALATAYDVADKVNQTGWNLYSNGLSPTLINPGDYVNFKSGKATKANIVTEASEGATISYDVNVDNTTIKIDSDGNKLAANTGDVDSVTSTEGNSKKGQVVIHKNPLEPSKTDSGKLATVDTVVKAVNNATWYAKAGNDKDAEVSEEDTKADETANQSAAMKAGETLGLKAGKNLRVKREGTNFTFALNKTVDLTKDGSLTIGGTTITDGGVTIAAKEDGKSPVTLTANGLNNGGNTITNVAEGVNDTDAVNLKQLKANISTESVDAATLTGDTNIATITVADNKSTGDKNAKYLVGVSKNTVKEAAREAIDVKGESFISVSNETKNGTEIHTVKATTGEVSVDTNTGAANTTDATGLTTNKAVADAINASGWKISEGSTSRGIVNPGNEVSFEGGEGTTVTVSDATNGKRTVTIASTVKPNEKGVIEEVTTTTTGDNAKKKGQVQAKSGDENKVTTVGNVASMINSAKWFAKASNTTDEVTDDNKTDDAENADGHAMSAGDKLTLKAGKNLRVKRDGADFTFALNNTVDLTNAGSLTIGGTTVTNDGVTIKAKEAGKTNVTLTANGLDNGGNKIVNVAAGKDETDAVNVAQLKSTERHITPTTYTYNDTDKSVTLTYTDGNGKVVANTEAKIDLSGLANKIKDYSFKTNATGSNLVGTVIDTTVASGKSVNFAASDNLTLKQDVKDGNVTYTYGLKNQVVVGEKGTPGADGKPGKDGVDGSIGVNGKDGSAVAINGKDGSIGLNGKDGKNGLTIKGQDGKVGVDGKDGETRLVYVEKADPTKPGSSDKTHELATLDDGQKYAGDNYVAAKDNQAESNVIAKKANERLDIVGGAKGNLTEGNIGVNAKDGKLHVQLAEKVNLGDKGSVTIGDTVVNNNGITINSSADPNGVTNKTVSLTNQGLNNGGNKIVNVAEGTKDTDAVNVKQLKDFKSEVAEGGLTFAGNSGDAHKAKLNSTVNIKGGEGNTDADQFDNGKNVMTKVNGNTVTVSIKKTPEVEGINIIDTTGKVKVKLTQTDEGLKVSDGNNNATRITNVKAGEKDTDAVNVKQLNAAKTEVTAGDNIDVRSSTGANGQTIYKVSANDTSAAVEAGSDHVKVTKAANTHKDGSTTVTDYTVDLSDKTKGDIGKGVKAYDKVTNEGLTFNADKGSTGVKKLGSKVSVNGDGKNITTTADENGVKVSMKDDIKVNSVTAKEVKVGDVNINENGINAGGKRITNVAPGKDGTDAVNVNQLKYVAGNISNQINNVDKGLRAGIAGALASGGLYHVTTAGKSMVSVGAGTYRGQNALAVGYSRLSDNGKVGVKFTVNSNSQGHAGASASVGYQW